MKTLLKGGIIISSKGSEQLDVLIEDQIIVKKEKNISELVADEVVDVSNKLLFPGFIDAHTHFDLSVANTTTADNFYTGTKAALIGGTTTIIDFATQYHGETLKEALNNWNKKVNNGSFCDYSFHMSISQLNDNIENEVQDMINSGITSFKLYLTYKDMILNDEDLYKIIKIIKEKGCFACVHCENDGVISALQKEKLKQGYFSPDNHYKTRPPEVEAEAVNRLLFICELLKAPVLIVHVSCEKALNVIKKYRKNNNIIYCETCPQYLILDFSLLNNEFFEESSKYICAPPLRSKDDQKALWEGIKNNDIQIVSSDHCSFNSKQRQLGKDNFIKIPGGLAGVEHRGIITYSYGIKNNISKEKICEVLSEKVAKLYGLYPKKGIIDIGSDADIVIIDPKEKYNISVNNSHYNIDYSSYENLPIEGKIQSVFLRGKKVVENNECICEPNGNYIKRQKIKI